MIRDDESTLIIGLAIASVITFVIYVVFQEKERVIIQEVPTKARVVIEPTDKRITIDTDQFSADYLLCLKLDCKLIQDWK